eukprot:TRINITY_DN4001_c0_g2_i1.p1 TRINITY_DN4001_c0_g2~~TRINITY_DN4001_c0_g2_i1.p1  ORF type:complete len:115 (+),score=3.02 TRINITY_DN4001_c0_g2_i1:3-347(+)
MHLYVYMHEAPHLAHLRVLFSLGFPDRINQVFHAAPKVLVRALTVLQSLGQRLLRRLVLAYLLVKLPQPPLCDPDALVLLGQRALKLGLGLFKVCEGAHHFLLALVLREPYVAL